MKKTYLVPTSKIYKVKVASFLAGSMGDDPTGNVTPNDQTPGGSGSQDGNSFARQGGGGDLWSQPEDDNTTTGW